MDIMRLGWDHSGAALTVSVDKKSDASARDGGGEVLRVAGDGINILHFLLGLVVCSIFVLCIVLILFVGDAILIVKWNISGRVHMHFGMWW